MASFREKKPVYDKLTGEQYFEPDMQLLREKLPNNPLCKRQYLKPDKHQKEALWALLDVVSKDEIVKNRRAWAKEQAKELLGKIAEEAGTLTAKMEKAENLEALEAIFTRIKEITEPVPDDVKDTMFKLADSVYVKMKDQLDPEKQKAAELEKLNQELLEADLEKAPQKVLAAYVRKLGDNLGVVPKDMKKATILPILQHYVASLAKEAPGDGKPKTEVPAESDKTNELKEENEELENENEELRDQNSDLEDENEELKDEKQELQQQNESLEEQLDAEKKSGTKAPENSKSTKSTRTSSGESSK